MKVLRAVWFLFMSVNYMYFVVTGPRCPKDSTVRVNRGVSAAGSFIINSTVYLQLI